MRAPSGWRGIFTVSHARAFDRITLSTATTRETAID